MIICKQTNACTMIHSEKNELPLKIMSVVLCMEEVFNAHTIFF